MNKVEVTCPCCDRYTYLSKEQVYALQHRQYTDKDVICKSCWRIFVKVRRRYRRLIRGDYADR